MKNLLLLQFGGLKYGVWEEEVPSLRDNQIQHRLPLSPDFIAGIAIIDNHTTTLIDLPVCLGLPGITGMQKGYLLIISKESELAGFALEGKITRLAVSEEQIQAMPPYLATTVVNTAVIKDTEAVPIINIGALYDRIISGKLEPPKASFLIPGIRHEVLDSFSAVRAFEAGGLMLSIPAKGVHERAVEPGRITRIPLCPDFVAGMSVYAGRVISVIHLARRLKLHGKFTERTMLMTEIAGDFYGILVDEDKEILLPSDYTIRPQPPLTRCPWMGDAILGRGRILPLIQLAELLGTPDDATNDPPLSERYTPASAFHESFGQQEVEVLEFSLTGGRHAVPKEEFRETLPVLPWCPVPNVQPIVIGIAEYAGELLPVIDLAMIFGRRSPVHQDWQMALVQNGDFRALAVIEASHEERRLPLELQRTIPIAVPHRVVYGCYPEEERVKLILNIEALTVHFEKASVREVIEAISQEMAQVPAKILFEGLEVETSVKEGEAHIQASTVPQAIVVVSEKYPRVTGPTVQIEAEERIKAEETGLQRETEIRQKAEEEAQERLEEEERAKEEEARLKREAEARARTEEAARLKAEEEKRLRAEKETRERFEEEERIRRAEERAKEEEARLKREAEARARAEAAARLRAEEEERLKSEEEAQERLEEEAKLHQAEEEERAKEEEARLKREAEVLEKAEAAVRLMAEEEKRLKAEREAQEKEREEAQRRVEIVEAEKARKIVWGKTKFDEEDQRGSEEERVKIGAENRQDREKANRTPGTTIIAQKKRAFEELTLVEGISLQTPSEMKDSVHDELLRRKKRFVYGTAVILVVCVLFVSIVLIKPKKDMRPLQVQEKKADVIKIPTPEPGPAITKVPKVEKSLEVTIHIVKRGDTLWAISKHYTGNPFNYPRVAKNNKIPNPDLIFPEQKISIRREEFIVKP